MYIYIYIYIQCKSQHIEYAPSLLNLKSLSIRFIIIRCKHLQKSMKNVKKIVKQRITTQAK